MAAPPAHHIAGWHPHLILRDGVGVPLPGSAYCAICARPCSAGCWHGPFWRSLGPLPFDREQAPGIYWWVIGHCGNSFTTLCKGCALRVSIRDAWWTFENAVDEAVAEFRTRGGFLDVTAREWIPPFEPLPDLEAFPIPPYPEAPAPEWWPWPSRTPTTRSPSVSSFGSSLTQEADQDPLPVSQ